MSKNVPFFLNVIKDKNRKPIDIIGSVMEKEILQKTQTAIRTQIRESMKSEIDPVYFAKNRMKVKLYSNQVDLVRAICDPGMMEVASLQARQAGKSYGAACGLIIAADKNIANNPDGTKIGVFANKEYQARLVREKMFNIIKNSEYFSNRIDWNGTTKTIIKWKSKANGGVGSFVKFLSGSESAHIEGESFDIILLDESQKISDLVFHESIEPMLGAGWGKVIQIGTPRRKNHFWYAVEEAHSQYVVIKKDFRECPSLCQHGITIIDGKPYPTNVLKRMPIDIRQELFPHNPEIKFLNKNIRIWDIPGKGMPTKYFKSQYLLSWLLDVSALLTVDEFKYLSTSDFDSMIKGEKGEKYYAGIDCTGSVELDEDKEGEEDDEVESHTSISIVRVRPDGTKEKVYHRFFDLKMDWIAQYKEIIEIIHPLTGMFPVEKCLIDIGNVGKPVYDFLKESKIPLEGILFQSRDKDSGKNMKNALYDEFIFDLKRGKWKYPKNFKEDVDMEKAYYQWEDVEGHASRSGGINKRFKQGNSNRGIDGCDSDVLAGYAVKYKSVPKKVRPQIGVRI